ncbi:RHS repeat-associated core domain-containing protein [Achromobacter xylosoxidans]
MIEETYDSADSANTRSVVIKRYDNEGRLAFQSYPVRSIAGYTDALKGVRTFYDSLGRTTTVEQDSELGVLKTTTEYLTGFQTRVTNPRLQKTVTRYMAYDEPMTDWPVSVTHPEGAVTDIARDVYGRPATLTRRNADSSTKLVRNFFYNSSNELCKMAEPETGTQTYLYDAAGNLKTTQLIPIYSPSACDDAALAFSTPPMPAPSVNRTYDARNQLRTLVFSDGKGNQTWSYTPDGLPKSIVADNGGGDVVTTSYSYNKRRLLVGERMAFGAVDWPVVYGYNANGNLASQSWHGVTLDYDPNALGQPRKVGSNVGNFATGVTYHPNGAIAQFYYGNSIRRTLTQNVRQLPSRGLEDNGTTKFLDDTYTYDQNGNVATIRDGLAGARGNRDMTYDGLDRLTKVKSTVFGTGADQSASYSYDVLDNLTRVVVGGPKARTQSYCYDTQWRLTNIKSGTCADGSTVIGLGYDGRGNVINKSGKGFTFDIGNRMRSATSGETVVASYIYDGLGRRVRDYTTASKVSHYLQNGQLSMTSDARTGKVSEFVYLSGSLLAVRERDTSTNTYSVKYQHTDALGSPVAVTDQARTVVERSEYEPFGQQIANRPIQEGPGYTGHVFDSSTGLNYMQQRYYDSAIGRFVSADPIGASSNTGSNFNRYLYGNNNPYRFVDPDGRASCDTNSGHGKCLSRANPDSRRAAPIYGTAQKSANTPTHASTSQRLADEAAVKRGVESAHMNRSMRTVTGNKSAPNIRPDVTVVHKSGKIDMVEVVSAGQTRQELIDKLKVARKTLATPGKNLVLEPDATPKVGSGTIMRAGFGILSISSILINAWGEQRRAEKAAEAEAAEDALMRAGDEAAWERCYAAGVCA